jgi:multicomponent Na+:H+ antiporter subunit A
MIFALVVPFVVAVVLAVARLSRPMVVGLAALPWVGWLVTAPWWMPAAVAGTGPSFHVDWMPSLGVGIGGEVDAVAAVVLLLVAGVGLAVVVYTGAYLSDPVGLRRFLATLTAFGASMAGLAVSDGLFGAFLWWEATTVTSYLLIGFSDRSSAARESARRALLTTSAGSLALLGGIVLVVAETGTDSFSGLAAAPPAGTVGTVALLLLFAGAFAKSAQVPFQGWLPGAMAAPTPASAYLHSATMVKAGILLLVRLAPAFDGLPAWTGPVTAVGLATMLVGAWGALRQTDLKLLLAHGTVSQLGFITALLGAGVPGVRFGAIAVLLAHGLFKSALFLVVGAIDHSTGTRDLRELSGVGRRHRVLAWSGALAAAAMAGVPPLFGFVTKEAAFHGLVGAELWGVLATIGLGSALTAAYALRFWFGAFGTRVGAEPTPTHAVGGWLAGPPAVLAGIGVVLGLVPATAEGLVAAAAGYDGHLVLWPGLGLALGVSVAALAAGWALWFAKDRVSTFQARVRAVAAALHLPTSDGGYRAAQRGIAVSADRLTGFVQHGSLPVYLAVIITSVLLVPTTMVRGGWGGPPTLAWSLPEVALLVAAVAAALVIPSVRRRMAAVLLVGAVGYAVAGVFVVSGAPDLALTMLLVETITVVLFAWVLLRLPLKFEQVTFRIGSAIRVAVAVFAGVVVGGGAYLSSAARTQPSVSEEILRRAVPEAEGSNVVNVILTDFRALDTLGEITVLVVAAVGIAGLLAARTAFPERDPDDVLVEDA